MFAAAVPALIMADSNCPPQWASPTPPCTTCPCPPGLSPGGAKPDAQGGAPGAGGNGRARITPASDKKLACSGCGGMPSWQVRESQVDFRLFDNPLRYTPAYGPAISLELVYQNWRETDLSYYPGNDVNGPFGRQWNCAWNSFMDVDFDGDVYVVAMGARTIYEFSGGSNTSEPDFQDGSRMQLIKNGGNVIIGGRVLKHDGSVVE